MTRRISRSAVAATFLMPAVSLADVGEANFSLRKGRIDWRS